MNKFGDKRRREQRRRNHIAKDLRTAKYRKRIVERRRQEPPAFDYRDDEIYDD